MTWLVAHWKLCALVASHLAIGAGAWLLKPDPPQPAVEWHARSGFEGAETDAVQVVEKQGPVRIVRHIVTRPGPGCIGPETDETTTEDRADASKETTGKEELRVAATEQQDAKVTPATAGPSKALGIRFDDPLGARTFRVEAGLRALGPFWLRVGWKPADGLKGLSPGVEVLW